MSKQRARKLDQGGAKAFEQYDRIRITGDPTFLVPCSLLGTPAVSLPVLHSDGLPLGLQLIGFVDQDAAMFAIARGILSLFDRE